MKSDFLIAVTQLAAERNLPREVVLSAIEAALVSAYRKDGVADGQDISVKLDPGSGEITVFVLKSVVDEVTDPDTEMTLAEAQKLRPDVAVGDNVTMDEIPHSAGRIAAQTAKQVVMQRLREAEREIVYEEYADRGGRDTRGQRPEAGAEAGDRRPGSGGGRHAGLRAGAVRAVPHRAEDAGPPEVGAALHQGPGAHSFEADSLFLKRLFEMEVPRYTTAPSRSPDSQGAGLAEQGRRPGQAGGSRSGGFVRGATRRPNPEHRQRAPG